MIEHVDEATEDDAGYSLVCIKTIAYEILTLTCQMMSDDLLEEE